MANAVPPDAMCKYSLSVVAALSDTGTRYPALSVAATLDVDFADSIAVLFSLVSLLVELDWNEGLEVECTRVVPCWCALRRARRKSTAAMQRTAITTIPVTIMLKVEVVGDPLPVAETVSVGSAVGLGVGTALGAGVGAVVGAAVGPAVGAVVVGIRVGIEVGWVLGETVGCAVGLRVG
mmetsp:Transcript_458/g.1295  ORF Transcript_458/g.1295 Transcript_458/m.1295 type:complete len:179 (-) Transcript_458:1011-1547(-)